MKPVKHLSRSTKVFIGLVILYIASTFILPASQVTKATYELTDMEYHYLLFVVRLPIIAVWCLTFYSYRMLHGYVKQIKDTAEGDDFAAISKGIYWISWGFLIPALISTSLIAIANSRPSFLMAALIITNYLYIIVSLFAFSYICNGAYALARRSKVVLTLKHIRVLVFAMVAIGVLFGCLVAAKLNGFSNSHNSYYMPGWVVWTTVVIPYLYAWFIGLFAAVELIMVSRRTSGIIYRRALQFLAIGLVLAIVSMFLMQYFRSIIPRTGHLAIGATLMTAYAIYALNAIGSIFLIIGAKRLKRIEDI